MNFFNIEGKGFEEAKKAIGDNLEMLEAQYREGSMKPGRYIGLYYIMNAAERGDITSQVALGNLYEFGSIVDRDSQEARRWYEKAIAQNHPKADGKTMLAAGAEEGMKRLGK